MNRLIHTCVALFSVLPPATAASVSYVLLQDSDENSLIRISADGKTIRTIASAAAGVGLAADYSGDYIIAARSKLLRVKRTGNVTTVAPAPEGTTWTAIALDANGNIIAADGKKPILWRISPDGQTVVRAATFRDLTYTAERPIALIIHPSGDYIVLLPGIDHRLARPPARMIRISTSGAATEVPLAGIPTWHRQLSSGTIPTIASCSPTMTTAGACFGSVLRAW